MGLSSNVDTIKDAFYHYVSSQTLNNTNCYNFIDAINEMSFSNITCENIEFSNISQDNKIDVDQSCETVGKIQNYMETVDKLQSQDDFKQKATSSGFLDDNESENLTETDWKAAYDDIQSIKNDFQCDSLVDPINDWNFDNLNAAACMFHDLNQNNNLNDTNTCIYNYDIMSKQSSSTDADFATKVDQTAETSGVNLWALMGIMICIVFLYLGGGAMLKIGGKSGRNSRAIKQWWFWFILAIFQYLVYAFICWDCFEIKWLKWAAPTCKYSKNAPCNFLNSPWERRLSLYKYWMIEIYIMFGISILWCCIKLLTHKNAQYTKNKNLSNSSIVDGGNMVKNPLM